VSWSLGKEYQIKISNWFAALENLNDSKDIKRAWENIKENNKTSATDSLGLYELKQHTPWFHEECLQFLNKRKQDKMQWLQDCLRGTRLQWNGENYILRSLLIYYYYYYWYSALGPV